MNEVIGQSASDFDKEAETIISWSIADLKAGYFCFYTSRKKHLERLFRKIGGRKNLLAYRETVSPKGAFTGALCHVPAAYLGEASFTIRTPRTERRPGGNLAGLKAYQERRKAKKLESDK